MRNNCARSLKISSTESSLQFTRSFSSTWRRHERIVMDEDPKLPGIDPSKLEITKTITPKQLVPNEDLVFGRTFTGL